MPSQQACYGASMDTTCEFLASECCDEKIVCRCLHVTEAQVVRMITQLELRTIREVKQITGAGDGCTACHSKLAECLEMHACPVELAVR
ncbi:MAG: (2Fe-2S)-binding protein [Gemmataceae bacterium]|nr:(2Fe-2S)-binding protein [Gemmataceae bacterium]